MIVIIMNLKKIFLLIMIMISISLTKENLRQVFKKLIAHRNNATN